MMPSEPERASQAAREGALVIVERRRGTLVVTESERLSWLHGIVTCDVAELEPGHGSFGLLLNKVGKIQTDLDVAVSADAVYLGVAPDRAGPAIELLGGYLIMEDAELEDESAARVWIRLHGPQSAELGRRIAEHQGVVFATIDWTGLGGAAVLVKPDDVEGVVDVLVASGGVLGDRADWDRLRLEHALPVFGVDYDASNNPHEASLERRAVSWSKGCYLGQEVVCTLDMRGKARRRIVPLAIEAPDVPEVGAEVRDDRGAAVGEVRSGARSAVLGKVLALATLKRKTLDSGVPLTVDGHAASVIVDSE